MSKKMRGGKRTIERESSDERDAHQTQALNDDDYDEHEVDGDEEVEEHDTQDAVQQQNLPDGFYEVEAIRRKRVRKGRLQYYIKWRGWPESTNTWEPPEHLQSCYDIVENFEESLRRKQKTPGRGRRKRKYGVFHTQSKKQQQQQPSTSAHDVVRIAQPRDADESASNLSLPETVRNPPIRIIETPNQAYEEGFGNVNSETEERRDNEATVSTDVVMANNPDNVINSPHHSNATPNQAYEEGFGNVNSETEERRDNEVTVSTDVVMANYPNNVINSPHHSNGTPNQAYEEGFGNVNSETGERRDNEVTVSTDVVMANNPDNVINSPQHSNETPNQAYEEGFGNVNSETEERRDNEVTVSTDVVMANNPDNVIYSPRHSNETPNQAYEERCGNANLATEGRREDAELGTELNDHMETVPIDGVNTNNPKIGNIETPTQAYVEGFEDVNLKTEDWKEGNKLETALNGRKGTIPTDGVNTNNLYNVSNPPHCDIGTLNQAGTPNQAYEEGFGSVNLETEVRNEDNELDTALIERIQTIPTEGINANNLEAKVSEGHVCVDGPSKVNDVEPIQSIRCTGAKRRKSGFVKRFKPEFARCEPNDAHTMTRITNGSCASGVQPPGIENSVSSGNDSGQKNKFDGSMPVITKIIKPICYSPSESDTAQDVFVTFLALRSDGKEVMVDNKFLKANNPLLLVDFYEQHLRYSPTP